ncbi:reverse transcriptase domain-containing protein [Tanacetum coccineum]
MNQKTYHQLLRTLPSPLLLRKVTRRPTSSQSSKKEGAWAPIAVAACKEVKELTKAGILRKVKHQTWVANPVMVKKSDGGWRMCVDFTYINKACPKDCYPLPEIDWKVESLSGFRLKCFLDTYKGYHQIQMAEGDEDKTTFFAGEGVFCYRKMPFGLKNAEATYQRLVDKVFHDQIGRNLEAYVDNTVIKTKSKEVFLQHRRSPVLRTSHYQALDKSQSLEAKAALQEMKKFVEILPTLTSSIQGEVLIMYLTALTESISAALFAKRKEEQVPIYFISRVLQGAELNYPGLENLILALVHATRRLRRYFQAHTKRGDETPKDFLIEVPLEDNRKETEGRPDTKLKKMELSYEWKLYTDGAASSDSSGVGLMLIDPEGKEYTYSLCFGFETTNNEVEYEALLAGLRIAQDIEITSLAIFVDSQLLVNQIKVLVEVLPKRSMEEKEILQVGTKEGESWMTHIYEYLVSGLLPENPKESRKIRVKAPQYKLIRGSLYRRSFYTSWLRCVASPQTDDIVKEIHKGSCG